MPRSRMVPALVALVPAIACTRPNPAFDGDELAGTSDEAATSTGTGTDATSEGTSTSTDATSDESATSVPGDLPAECNAEVGHAFELRYMNPLELGLAECPGEFGTWGKLSELDGVLRLYECTQGCQVCGDMSYPLALDYDLTPVLESCLYIEGEEGVVEGDWCRWAALSVFDGIVPANPYLIAANRKLPTGSALALLGGGPELPSEAGMLVPDQTCSCAAAGFDETCCQGELPFSTYPLVFGNVVAPVGASLPIIVPNSPLDHDFYNAMAQQRGTCTMAPELAWKVYATNLGG